MKTLGAVSLFLVLAAVPATAQDQDPPDRAADEEQQATGYSARIQSVQFNASNTAVAVGTAGFAGAVVAGAPFGGGGVVGAPYSADAVTESIQMLADGNRIRQRNETKLYRDSEGRTRREQSLNAMGPWQVLGNGGRMVFVNDPIAQQSFILNLDQRTAQQFAAPGVQPLPLDSNGNYSRMPGRFATTARPTVPGGDTGDHDAGRSTLSAGNGDSERSSVFMAAPTMTLTASTGQSQSTEDLGERNIEGVSAFGSRTTVVIEANTIGNDLPIEITTERWFSPRLGSLVMSRHSDPRFGEVTYRLINVSLAEPDPMLFQIPDGFQVTGN